MEYTCGLHLDSNGEFSPLKEVSLPFVPFVGLELEIGEPDSNGDPTMETVIVASIAYYPEAKRFEVMCHVG